MGFWFPQQRFESSYLNNYDLIMKDDTPRFLQHIQKMHEGLKEDGMLTRNDEHSILLIASSGEDINTLVHGSARRLVGSLVQCMEGDPNFYELVKAAVECVEQDVPDDNIEENDVTEQISLMFGNQNRYKS